MENDETDVLDAMIAAAGLPPVPEEAQDWEVDFKPKIVEVLAENMAIYAGAIDHAAYLPLAKEVLRRFRAIKGRDPVDYLEVEEWCRSTLDKSGRLHVLPGGNAA